MMPFLKRTAIFTILGAFLLALLWKLTVKPEFALSIQVGFSLAFGLFCSVSWIHFTYPIVHTHFWRLEKSRSFLMYVFTKWWFLVSLLLSLLILTVFDNHIHRATFWSLLNSMLISTVVFSGIGTVSLEWRTGKKGNRIRALAKETGSIMAPIGSFPSLFRTIIVALGTVFCTNFLFLQSSFWLDFSGILFVSLLLVLIRFKNTLSVILSDNAFFDEYFLVKESDTIPKSVPSESLFWVPKTWRTDVRFLLTQHVRRSSIGRLLILGHVVYALLILTKPEGINPHWGLMALMMLLFTESAVLYHPVIIFPYRATFLRFTKVWFTHVSISIRWIPLFSIAFWISDFPFFISVMVLAITILISSLIWSFLTFKRLVLRYG